MFGKLGRDHRDWLLITSYNLLLQRKAERAATLLELLSRMDPDCPQCRRLLAYANLLLDDREGCSQALERIRKSSDELDQAVVRFISERVAASAPQSLDS
ncbi:MAG: hypothetical protein OXJ53_13590 [Gammaproteobacteria bacterium]|nr:hypothetical protein [Gammaproteobacteria bacterium]MDE0273948.1 hypothetical protein [Gammaproteobacteria bacterium]